jgi:mannose-6-phosphate isomerase-like protein (cupin superfamily)
MADYTKINLKELEDSAVRFGLSPNLEARFARGALELEQSGLSYQRLAPGFRQPFGHRHAQQEEIYVILGGAGRLKLGDDVVDVRALDAVRVPGETMRAFEAGDEGLELLAFGAPQAEAPGGDLEMEQDWWSD